MRARVVHAAAILVLLAAVSRYYDRATGFTALVGFGDKQAASVVPALRDLPHEIARGSNGYDGQFYAQMAFDPLLRDPATDHAMDDAPLRARRILLSWTSYALGVGRPAWILQVYALLNVMTWIALSVVLRRWFPLISPRGLFLWLLTLFSAGLMWSVRFALLDGPSLLLLALAMAALESGRRWLAALVCGIAGLARETNVLGICGLIDPGEWRRPRSIARQLALVATALLPLAVWFDYIHSIYRSLIFTSGETLTTPFAGMLWRVGVGLNLEKSSVQQAGFVVLMVVAFATQIGWLLARPRWHDAWWRVGVAYAALLPFLGPPLWTGTPPTAVRVELPLLLAFNIGLVRVQGVAAFWTLASLGNAAIVLQPLIR